MYVQMNIGYMYIYVCDHIIISSSNTTELYSLEFDVN